MLRIFTVTAGLLAAGVLAACVPPPAAPVAPPGNDQCRASAYQGFVGQPLGTLRTESVSAPVRVLSPNGVMSLEYRADRMNVSHDSNNRITRIYCG